MALSNNKEIIAEKYINEPKAHATLLAKYIKDILLEKNITIADCCAVAVSEGPGSYTGLRVGVSCAKGLCYGAKKPLVAVGTLAAIAQCAIDNPAIAKEIDNKRNAFLESNGKKIPLLIVPMVDARRMEVYTAVFNEKGEQQTETQAKILDGTSFSQELDSSIVLFTGNGALKFKPLINHPNAIFAEQLPHATGMRIIADELYNKKEFKDNAYFEPFYLKDFVAGKPKKLL